MRHSISRSTFMDGNTMRNLAVLFSNVRWELALKTAVDEPERKRTMDGERVLQRGGGGLLWAGLTSGMPTF